jgi:hypothetical protein
LRWWSKIWSTPGTSWWSRCSTDQGLCPGRLFGGWPTVYPLRMCGRQLQRIGEAMLWIPRSQVYSLLSISRGWMQLRVSPRASNSCTDNRVSSPCLQIWWAEEWEPSTNSWAG